MNSKVVIFENESGGISLLDPMMNCGLTVEEIALKDVPPGMRFKIVNSRDLPDPYFFNAWKFDFKDHDGIGLGADDFWRTVGKDKLDSLINIPQPEILDDQN